MLREPLLSARRITIGRGRREIWREHSFDLGVGVTALLGPNGAGKSTLIEALAMPNMIRSGEIDVDGHSPRTARDLREYWSSIGYMPQDWQAFSAFTVGESVEYVAWLKGVRQRERAPRACRALEMVGLLSHRDVKVRRLSGGMKQRVGLAESLVNEPRFVFLDEPTTGLDPEQRVSFRQALRTHAQDRAVLLSTHMTDDVRAVADRVIVVAQSRVLFDGTPTALAARSGPTDSSASALEAGYLDVLSRARAEGV